MTVLSLEDFKKKYPLIDEIHYVEDMELYFEKHMPQCVYVNSGVNCDSGIASLPAEDKFYSKVCQVTDRETLYNIVNESRVIKNDEEIEIMRWSAQISCEAHVNVMRNIKPGMRESQMESFFKFDAEQKYFAGRVQPYTSICCCGPTNSTLHYHEAN